MKKKLFFILILLFLLGCRTVEESIVTEVQLPQTVSTISYEEFSSKVNRNANYNSISKYFDVKIQDVGFESTKSDYINNSFSIITENIIKIETEQFTTYTFGLNKNSEDNGFYNIILYVNKNNQIFKSYILKYKPKEEWLDSFSENFRGNVSLVNDYTLENIKLDTDSSTEKQIDDCIDDVIVYWTCSMGNAHSPYVNESDCSVNGGSHSYVVEVNYGMCSGTSGNGDFDTGEPSNTSDIGTSSGGGGNNNIITAPNTIPYETKLKSFQSGTLAPEERVYYTSNSNIKNLTDRYLIDNNFSGPSQFTAKNALEFGSRFQLNFEQYRWVLNNKKILFEDFQNFLFSNTDFNLTKAVINQFLQNPDIKWKEFEPTLNFVNKFLEDNPDTTDKEDIFNRIKALDLLLIENPAALLDIKCQELSNWKTVAEHQVPQALKNKLNNIQGQTNWFNSWEIQNIDNASGPSLNMDLFSVRITNMPFKPKSNVKYTPSEFFDFFRKNINLFAEKFTPIEDNNYNIHDTALWDSPNPLSSLIHIEIPGDNGTVMCTGYNMGSSSGAWVFTTIKAPIKLDGIHPVSGHRLFGFWVDNSGFMYLFTRGVDRFSKPIPNATLSYLSENYAFSKADDLWSGMQNKLVSYIQEPGNGGLANKLSPVTYRRAYTKIRNYLKGKATIQSLGCN